MTIGEIAERFGLATHVLRHWESMRLLAPARAEGARRRYGPDDLYRVAVILRAKDAGFSLADIRQMITAQDPTARRGLLQRQHAELARRIAEAQASLELIECALDCDHDDFIQCAHFQAVVADRIGIDSPAQARV
jgi:DNA-binding transcriptional MerR regulator